MTEPFRELSHTADAGIEAFGKTIEEAFSNTALGMLKIAGVAGTVPDKEKTFSVSAPDRSALLIDFLNEILFIINASGWNPASVKCIISGNSLKAVLKGSEDQSVPDREIKAATYHGLEVSEENGKWKTTVFFDL